MLYFTTIICYVLHIIVFIVILYWQKWFWAIRRLVHPSFSNTKLNKISTSNIEPLGSILHIDIMYVQVYYVGKRMYTYRYPRTIRVLVWEVVWEGLWEIVWNTFEVQSFRQLSKRRTLCIIATVGNTIDVWYII